MVDFSLLDSSVDELHDLEGFEPIPAGTHKLQISWNTKDINDKPAVLLELKVIETIEMADQSAAPPEPGKTSDIAFILINGDGEKNTISEGQLKEVILELRETFGGDSIRETMDASEGAEVIATLNVRANKNDPDQKYNGIKKLWIEE